MTGAETDSGRSTATEAPALAERLERARDLVAAIESGDAEQERRALLRLRCGCELGLHRELDRIVSELRGPLSELCAIGELASVVHAELPEAQQRLNQVMKLTEVAAHTTLGAIEDSIPLIDRIINALHALGGSEAPLADCETLKGRLGEVLLAQSFQDLTGQMIGGVAALVGELERLLSRHAAGAEPAPEPSERVIGGGLPTAGAEGNVVQDQRDVDELLSEMGV